MWMGLLPAKWKASALLALHFYTLRAAESYIHMIRKRIYLEARRKADTKELCVPHRSSSLNHTHERCSNDSLKISPSTEVFNTEDHMTSEMGNPTFRFPKLSNEVSFSAMFLRLFFLNQQCVSQTSFIVCFVSLSKALLPILWTLLWLLSFSLYLKSPPAWEGWRVVPLCIAQQLTFSDVLTLLLLNQECWTAEGCLPRTGRARPWAQAFMFFGNSF